MADDAKKFKDEYVRANGLKFHYLDWGHAEKPPMVLLHGVGQTCHTWDLFAAAMAEDFHVMAFDQRGHGDTDWAADKDYSRTTMVADTNAFTDADADFGELIGIDNDCISAAASTHESNSVTGIHTTAKMAGDTDVNGITGIYNLTDVDDGTVDGFVKGGSIGIDIESAAVVSDSIMGLAIDLDTEKAPGDTARAIQVYMRGSGLHATDDIFLNMYDSVNSDTVARITALAGVATFDSGDFSGAPDYAEYFEAALAEHTGSGIPIGTTVAISGSKVLPASQSGQEPIGVVRPKWSSSVICGSAPTRWNEKYLKDAYDGVIMESYTMKNWTEEISFAEFSRRGKDDTGGVLGGHVKDTKEEVSGSTIYYREHKYHSDRIPSGSTVPESAVTITPASTRKKLNPEYNASLEYTPRQNRNEWTLVGLLGQIPITDGQPTGSNWINMGQVSESVTRWFVK